MTVALAAPPPAIDEYGFALGINTLPAELPRGLLHLHMDVEVNLVLEGELTCVIGGTPRRLGSGGLLIFWAGVPHGLESAAAGTEYLWVTIPLVRFLTWNLPHAWQGRLLGGEVILDAGRSGREEDALAARRWVRDHGATDAEARAVMLEIEARIMRLKPDELRQSQAVNQAAACHLERMVRFISTYYVEQIDAEDIARAARLHPNYAMHVFRRATGISIWEYVLRLRVAHAQRLLAASEASVLEVAMASGFGSQSQFYETFTRFSGTTPARYRGSRTMSMAS